jgi:antitoxin (DNA-binding transcriptional repressor) of toxin-antitoxin stability system
VYTVNATELKNRLGPILARAELEPVAVMRHGRVVAFLTPASAPPKGRSRGREKQSRGLSRREEERLVKLCASGDLRPSRWRRAGDSRLLAGLAVMMASEYGAPRMRLLALAERLSPGMTDPDVFGRWLAASPLKPSRFMPMVAAERRLMAR